MRKEMVILFVLLAACTQNIVCDEKLTCEDGRVFPAEHKINGTCAPVQYLRDPCSPVNQTITEAPPEPPEPTNQTPEPATPAEPTLTWQDARELVKDAFHQKWSALGAKCGKHVEGRQEPHVIQVYEEADGYRVHIEYYCGEYAVLPPQPDHQKDVRVNLEGKVTGI